MKPSDLFIPVRVYLCFAITCLPVVTPFVNKIGSQNRVRILSSLRSTVDDSIKLESWDNFVKCHVGKWCGIQSSHYHLDEEQTSAAERILCGTFLTLKDQCIEHVNFYVSDPIDFETDAVISSDRIETQNVAVYQKPALSSKVCGSVSMGGPGMSREGLSVQFSFRHEDCRIRVMVAYEPSDFVAVPSTSIQIPSSMSMSDITISREKMLQDMDPSTFTLPPAKQFTEAVPHFLWRTTSMDGDFGGLFSGVKDVFIRTPKDDTGDKIQREEVPPGALPFFEEYEENMNAALLSDNILGENGTDDDDDDLEFVKIYDGGLLVQAPLVILAGDESEVKISWSVPNSEGEPTSRTIYVAEASFTAMNDVVNKTRRKRRGDPFVDQPILLNYSVQTLKRE